MINRIVRTSISPIPTNKYYLTFISTKVKSTNLCSQNSHTTLHHCQNKMAVSCQDISFTIIAQPEYSSSSSLYKGLVLGIKVLLSGDL